MKTCTITVVMTLFTECGPSCLTGIFSHLRSKLGSSGCQLKSPNRELYNRSNKTLIIELKISDPSALHTMNLRDEVILRFTGEIECLR